MSAKNNQNGEQHQVGHGRPPAEFRFKKGQSGNPKGRPRGSKNFMTLLQHELQQQVAVQENGVRRKITKREAMVKQLVHKAASGDIKAFLLLLPHILEADALTRARSERTVGGSVTIDLLAGAVQILADARAKIPVPRAQPDPK